MGYQTEGTVTLILTLGSLEVRLGGTDKKSAWTMGEIAEMVCTTFEHIFPKCNS